MRLSEAIESGIMTVDEQGNLHYSGRCNDCVHSKCHSHPSNSNMCMNKESEWYGCFHVDYGLDRYVNGCSVLEEK